MHNVAYFFKITLDKVRMYKDTHLRSFFFYREWAVRLFTYVLHCCV